VARGELQLPGLGLFHGTFLVVERIGLKSWLERRHAVVRHAYVMLTVMVGWVFFRAENLPRALSYLATMWGCPPATRCAIPRTAPRLRHGDRHVRRGDRRDAHRPALAGRADEPRGGRRDGPRRDGAVAGHRALFAILWVSCLFMAAGPTTRSSISGSSMTSPSSPPSRRTIRPLEWSTAVLFCVVLAARP